MMGYLLLYPLFLLLYPFTTTAITTTSKCRPFSESDPSPRIVVTRGSSYLSMHLHHRLTSETKTVRLVEDLSFLNNNKSNNYYNNNNDNICFVDLSRQSESLLLLFRLADWVVHIASVTTDRMDYDNDNNNPLDDLSTFSRSLSVNSNVIAVSARANVSRFVYVNTDCGNNLYDFSTKTKVVNNRQHQYLKREPSSASSRSKEIGEFELSLLNNNNFSYTILRLQNIYGPVSSFNNNNNRNTLSISHLVYKAIKSRQGQGHHPFRSLFNSSSSLLLSSRDWLFIDDAVDSIVYTLSFSSSSSSYLLSNNVKSVFQIGTGTAVSVHELVVVIAKITNYCYNNSNYLNIQSLKSHFENNNNNNKKKTMDNSFVAFSSYTKSHLGWESTVSFGEGVTRIFSFVLDVMNHTKLLDEAAVDLFEKQKCFDSSFLSLLVVNQISNNSNNNNNSQLINNNDKKKSTLPKKQQDSLVTVKLESVEGDIHRVLPKIFCGNDRAKVLGEMDEKERPKKTLVVITASTRSHHITWPNFRSHILGSLDADLALAVLPKPIDDEFDSFRESAKYYWEINPPKDNDYMHFYDQISRSCFNHPFNESYARIIGEVNRKTSGWVGCIKAANQQACAALITFFRWFAIQNILNERLYEIYGQVIITRSDFLWVSDHADVKQLINNNDNKGVVWIPKASDYDGLSDRHFVFSMYEAIRCLDLADAVVERDDPIKQRKWLIDNNFDGGGSSEYVNKVWLTSIKKLVVKRFRHTGMIVIDGDDKSVSSGFGYIEPREITSTVYIKYPDEYEYLKKNSFNKLKLTLKEGDIVRFSSSKTCYLIRNQMLSPFHDFKAFVKMGFDLDQVKAYPDEDLQQLNLPFGPEIFA